MPLAKPFEPFGEAFAYAYGEAFGYAYGEAFGET